TRLKTTSPNIASVMPVRNLAASGYATAVLSAGARPPNRRPNADTTVSSASALKTTSSVADAVMQMPETKNISMLPLDSGRGSPSTRAVPSSRSMLPVPLAPLTTRENGSGSSQYQTSARLTAVNAALAPAPKYTA